MTNESKEDAQQPLASAAPIKRVRPGLRRSAEANASAEAAAADASAKKPSSSQELFSEGNCETECKRKLEEVNCDETDDSVDDVADCEELLGRASVLLPHNFNEAKKLLYGVFNECARIKPSGEEEKLRLSRCSSRALYLLGVYNENEDSESDTKNEKLEDAQAISTFDLLSEAAERGQKIIAECFEYLTTEDKVFANLASRVTQVYEKSKENVVEKDEEIAQLFNDEFIDSLSHLDCVHLGIFLRRVAGDLASLAWCSVAVNVWKRVALGPESLLRQLNGTHEYELASALIAVAGFRLEQAVDASEAEETNEKSKSSSDNKAIQELKVARDLLEKLLEQKQDTENSFIVAPEAIVALMAECESVTASWLEFEGNTENILYYERALALYERLRELDNGMIDEDVVAELREAVSEPSCK